MYSHMYYNNYTIIPVLVLIIFGLIISVLTCTISINYLVHVGLLANALNDLLPFLLFFN